MENGGKKEKQEPVVFVKGDGQSYSREELAEKLGISLEEFDSQVETYEFPLADSSMISGKVENGVHIPIYQEIEHDK